jgi:glycosyltransferase involved in cell wall biosynthesis
MQKIRITYACFLNQSGYSCSAQSNIFALQESGLFDIKVKIFGGKPSQPSVSDEKYEYFLKMAKKQDDEDRILIYHCIPTMQKRVKKIKKSIGMAVFETYNPPEQWIDILNDNDAIIVPSQFNYKIFSHMKIKKPLYYVPHCIDMDTYNKEVIPIFQRDKYTFLFMGIWRERKGYKQLLEAWLKEFNENDNVQLLIKTDKAKKAEDYIGKLKKQIGINKGFAPILFENKIFDEKNMPGFMKSVDCLVAPTMGEGFYLPGLQSMALGVPVIVTNFSGCQDYANKDTAILLEPNGFVFRNNMDNIPQFRNKKWAFVEVKKIQEAMRYVINNKEQVKIKVDTACNEVKNKFNYEETSKSFINMIREIYG